MTSWNKLPPTLCVSYQSSATSSSGSDHGRLVDISRRFLIVKHSFLKLFLSIATYPLLRVTGGGSVGECDRLSHAQLAPRCTIIQLYIAVFLFSIIGCAQWWTQSQSSNSGHTVTAQRKPTTGLWQCDSR